MELLDSLAFWGRKYERQRVRPSGDSRFSLRDLLDSFNRNAIIELTPVVRGKPGATVKPDLVRKVKVSLLDDGVAAVDPSARAWFEVFRTGPSGDLSKVRVVAHTPDDGIAGEIRMLVGRRSYEHYFREDPILGQIAGRGG